MVDLVKIRKKAKEKKEAEQAAASPNGGQAPSPVEAPSPGGGQAPSPVHARTPVRETSPEPQQKPSAAAKPSKSQKQKAATPSEAEAAAAGTGEGACPPPLGKRFEPSKPPEKGDTPAAATAPAPEAAPTTPQASARLDRFKAEAGRLREQADVEGETAERVEHVAIDQRLEVLTFAIGAETYAVDIEHIVEIVPVRNPTRVPNAEASVVGILSLRGTIVTLVDVHRRLKHGRSASSADSRIIVVDQGGETIGFEVDRVFRVVKIDAAEIEPHPVVHTSELDESIRGVFRQGQALTILLDFDKLLDRREMPRAGALDSLTSQA